MINLKKKQNYNPIYSKLLVIPDKKELTECDKLDIMIDGTPEEISYINLPSFKDQDQDQDMMQRLYGDKTYTDRDLQKRRDRYVFDLFQSKTTSATNITISQGALDSSTFALAFAIIESRELTPAKIICHPMQYKSIRMLPDFQESTMREIIIESFYGHLHTADIHVSTQIKIGSVYVLPTAETLGVAHFKRNKVASKILDSTCVVKIEEWYG